MILFHVQALQRGLNTDAGRLRCKPEAPPLPTQCVAELLQRNAELKGGHPLSPGGAA
jgi:hypothetical protein